MNAPTEQTPSSWQVQYPEPIRRFIHHDASDQLLHISMQLAAELWVVKRRLAEVESQLVDADVITSPDRIRREPAFTFDRAERDQFVKDLFGVLLEPTD
jgi:hypothetical protein